MSTARVLPECENESTPPVNMGRVFLANLPISVGDVFGREPEIHMLDSAWNAEYPHLIVIFAPDGMGKTALVSHWLRQMQTDGYRGAERILGWSFSVPRGREASADEFLLYALKSCGDPAPAKGSPWNKGRRLARLICTQRTLLILDNVDALQYQDGEMQGRLKDPGLKALLYELSRINSGLCIVTTCLAIKDFEHRTESEVQQRSLSSLSSETGTQLLRSCNVTGPLDTLKAIVREFDGHPLALTLLGGYLLFRHHGDIRKIDLNPSLGHVKNADRHVRRIVDAFTIWLQRKPELNILFIMGLLDLLLEVDAMNALHHDRTLEALLRPPAIKGVTDYVHECSSEHWQSAITRLRNLRLLTENTVFFDTSIDVTQETPVYPEQRRILDCHLLVREYFAEQLCKRLPDSWQETQNRLYDYYTHRAEKALSDTLEEMQPLFAAIRHGCQAGQYQYVFQNIYWNQIHRDTEDYCAKTLGAPGADFVALSHFFTPSWKHPVEYLPDEIQIRLLDIAAMRLEEAGRWREATELVKKGMVFWNTQGNWEEAARHANILSRLLLPLGEVEQAVIHAHLALQLTEQSEDRTNRMIMRMRLISVLHLSGNLQEAEQVCRETEAFQQEQALESLAQKASFTDFTCCDLLLRLEKYREVQERIARRIEEDAQERSPLNMAVGKLLSAKISLLQAVTPVQKGSGEKTSSTHEVRDLLNQAIEALRDIGELEWLIQGLLTRSTLCRTLREFSEASADLAEIRELIKLGDLSLYLADYHLESARLVYEQFAIDQGRFSSDAAGEEFHQQMHDHVEVAEALIWQMGYHLRDADLETVMTLLKDAIPERVEEVEIIEQDQEIRWPPKQDQEIERPAQQKQEIEWLVKQDQEIKWVEQQEQKIRQAEDYQNVYLYPGELHIAERPTTVWTLLGSCIAVVFYNERLRLGAICHAQLPEKRFRDATCRLPCNHPCYKDKDAPDSERFKYVACSIRYMYDQFTARGITSDEITVKLFGGASVLEMSPGTINVAVENVKTARKVLQEYSLKLVRKDVGGQRGRTLYFYSDTGKVFMKRHRTNEKRSYHAFLLSEYK